MRWLVKWCRCTSQHGFCWGLFKDVATLLLHFYFLSGQEKTWDTSDFPQLGTEPFVNAATRTDVTPGQGLAKQDMQIVNQIHWPKYSLAGFSLSWLGVKDENKSILSGFFNLPACLDRTHRRLNRSKLWRGSARGAAPSSTTTAPNPNSS